MNTLVIIGQIVLGLFFLMSGLNHFMKYDMMVSYGRIMKLPMPALSVVLSGLVMVFGAIILFGLSAFNPVLVKWGLGLLIAFLVLVSFMMHRFWSMPADKRMENMLYFKSNIALAAALLMIFATVV
ncbi:MAG: putative oxidoreductase [Planctomycetota bacterium]|jgi:putative oxidoreductase